MRIFNNRCSTIQRSETEAAAWRLQFHVPGSKFHVLCTMKYLTDSEEDKRWRKGLQIKIRLTRRG